jgi:hypothetical protein
MASLCPFRFVSAMRPTVEARRIYSCLPCVGYLIAHSLFCARGRRQLKIMQGIGNWPRCSASIANQQHELQPLTASIGCKTLVRSAASVTRTAVR